ncbi:MAG: hypothetical protein IT371_09965 [Deltaproteobacteria bacterium]|nr:hypothetical protein [Deltaproteobacteria bacterium]
MATKRKIDREIERVRRLVADLERRSNRSPPDTTGRVLVKTLARLDAIREKDAQSKDRKRAAGIAKAFRSLLATMLEDLVRRVTSDADALAVGKVLRSRTHAEMHWAPGAEVFIGRVADLLYSEDE